MKEYRVAVVGAAGMVGQEFVKILEQRSFPVSGLHFYASDGSKGKKLFFIHREIAIEETNHRSFTDIDIAFFCGDVNTSRHFAPSAVRAGAVVVDSSDAWRMEGNVPLIVPEVNIEDASGHRGILINPTCTIIEVAMALFPLHKINPLKRVIAVTYQSVSGAGIAAVEELTAQVLEVLDGQLAVPRVFPHQIAFNILPEVDVFLDTGYTKEEKKLQEETRKILHAPELEMSATCVRVPVFIGHSAALHAEFTQPFPADVARQVLTQAAGIKVMDDTTISLYPQPWTAAGRDECYVGRIRRDTAFKNGLAMWVVTDNVRKGAALNAVQIFEELIKRGWLAPGGQK